MSHSDSFVPRPVGLAIQAYLDGIHVPLPSDANSLAWVRFHLETLALEQSRILCRLKVDGNQVNLADSLLNHGPFACVEAEAIDVEQLPLQFLQTAQNQIVTIRAHVLAAVSRVLINDSANARVLWWSLALNLKNPLLTLSLVRDRTSDCETAGASVRQLRKWQFQQLAAIMREIEEISWSQDTDALSCALEQRVLPWLSGLERFIALLQGTIATALPDGDPAA